jgi:hypothetical protein
MKTIISILTFLPLASVFSQSWSIFKDPDQIFEIEIPGEIEQKEKRILTGIDTIDVYSYVVDRSEEKEPNFLYLVNVADYPEGTFPPDSIQLIEDFLEASVESLVLNLGGNLDYTVSHSLLSDALLLRISQEDKNTIIKAVVLLSKDRFFTLQVFTHKQYSLNEDVDRFLNSFALLH